MKTFRVGRILALALLVLFLAACGRQPANRSQTITDVSAAIGTRTAYLPNVPQSVPTQAEATPTTQAPTQTAPPAEIWRPVPGASWQIQYAGALDTSFDVQMYDLDLVETAQIVIDGLHAQGRKVVCYFSAGSWEEWRPDADAFPADVKGKDLEGWPGEKWLDIRRIDSLGPIMEARMRLALEKGCDGVDPDNMDGYSNDSGFDLGAQDQLTYNIWIANTAHQLGLAVGLKNDVDQVNELVAYFDWQLNEQCFQYNECELLLPFIQANKPVFGIEYEGELESFCPQANAMNLDVLKKNMDLDAWRQACR